MTGVREPTHGWVGPHPIHAHTRHYLPDSTAVQRFNSRVAVAVTRGVGTMWCAYAFAAFDLISLPDAIKAGRSAIVSWIAQTFLQLVLLAVIMVGQAVQAAASDARAAKTLKDAEAILDALNLETAGGLRAVLDAITALGPRDL